MTINQSKLVMAAVMALALTIATEGAMAQSAAGGAYLGGAIGAQSADVKLSDASGQITLGAATYSAVPGIFAGYGMLLGRSVYLGAEAAYQFVGPEINDVSVTGLGRLRASIRNAWSVSALPGVALSDRVLVYGRAGFGNLRGEAEADSGGIQTSDKATYNAVIYGAGVSYSLTPEMLLRGEWTVSNGREKNGIRPVMSGFNFGIAYRF